MRTKKLSATPNLVYPTFIENKLFEAGYLYFYHILKQHYDVSRFHKSYPISNFSIPQKRQLEIALKICKELFFEYQNFYEFYKWGNPDLLLDGINLIEKGLTDYVDFPRIKELIPKIDSVIPDMDDFASDWMGSYALNASASVSEALEFLIDNDKNHIVNICTYYTDTIDFKIQEETVLTQEQIDEHTLMIKARQFLLTETK